MGLFEETLERTHRLAQKMLEEEEERRKHDEEEQHHRKIRKLYKQKKEQKEKALNAWRLQHPSAIVSMRVIGDPAYATLFYGEGKVLLYRVINDMKFNNLKSHQDERRYPDGTIVRASSVFGQNMIEIDVSKSTAAPGALVVPAYTCEISFDVPNIVQPMMNPGVIAPGESDGIDYLKIYYTVNITECPDCKEIKWEVSTKACSYSFELQCWGQVVMADRDDNGTFIILKLFTEKTFFSRTGLSDMNLKAWIEKPDGSEACKNEGDIHVDCCHKNPTLRPVAIYWDYNCGLSPSPCLVPLTINYSDLYDYSNQGGLLYSLAEKKGSCIPMTWLIVGYGSLTKYGLFNETAKYNPPQLSETISCEENLFITLKDRCDTEYTVNVPPCCGTAVLPVEILYLTLGMLCDQSQDLQAHGGCMPYKWGVDYGTLSVSKNTQMATYTAPSTNADCAWNPTITLTDCCGEATQIKIAVNCYTANDDATGIEVANAATCYWDSYNELCKWTGNPENNYCHKWDCHGILTYDYHFPVNTLVTYGTTFCTTNVYDKAMCESLCAAGPDTWCDRPWNCAQTRTVRDFRSAGMKSAGCCPLNPLTGLPF